MGKYFVEVFRRYNEVLKKPVLVDIYDNNFEKNSYDKKANLSFKNKDVSQKFKVNKKIDIIIHAAGIASPFYYRQKPLETLDVAINGTRNCLEIAKNLILSLFF